MKHYAIILSLLLLISSPIFANNFNDTMMSTPTCETYPEWTGSKVDDIDLSVLGDRPYRIIRPDFMVTMDYSPDRLNIHVTDEGIILTQDCG